MKQEPSPRRDGNASPAEPVTVRIVLVIHEVSRNRNTTMGPSSIRPGIGNPRYDRAQQGMTNVPGPPAPAPGTSNFPPASSHCQNAPSGPAKGSAPFTAANPGNAPHPAPLPRLEGALGHAHLRALLREKQALDAAKASASAVVDNEADIEIVLVLYV